MMILKLMIKIMHTYISLVLRLGLILIVYIYRKTYLSLSKYGYISEFLKLTFAY